LFLVFVASGEWPTLQDALPALAAMIAGGAFGLLLHGVLRRFREPAEPGET
jgi:hypothetical protein